MISKISGKKMNLKKASLFLILGLIYTLFHKTVVGLFPNVSNYIFLKGIFSILSLISALTILLFIVFFFKEVSSLNSQIKTALQFTFFFTGIIILLGLPIELLPQNRIFRNLIFETARFLNSLSILMFFIYLNKIIYTESLHKPIMLTIWGFSIGLIIGLISLGYYFNFILTGNETVPFFPLQYLAVIIFLFKYLMVIYFLFRFSKIEDYTKLIET